MHEAERCVLLLWMVNVLKRKSSKGYPHSMMALAYLRTKFSSLNMNSERLLSLPKIVIPFLLLLLPPPPSPVPPPPPLPSILVVSLMPVRVMTPSAVSLSADRLAILQSIQSTVIRLRSFKVKRFHHLYTTISAEDNELMMIRPSQDQPLFKASSSEPGYCSRR